MKLRKTIHSAVAILLYGMLTACVSTPPPEPHEQLSNRAMAVPTEAGMLAQGLRRSLRERGWSLIEYDAEALTRSRNYAGLANRSEYRLTLSGERIGDCRGGRPSYLYNLAVIENASGRVDLALTGASCLDTLIDRFARELDRRKLAVPRVRAGG